ncbi:hypothetical protein C0989_000993 [Termitomyces sp. Mn162]|nr:hypothetical protein C0989_000993 [Termitomyces sp. Mn162]
MMSRCISSVFQAVEFVFTITSSSKKDTSSIGPTTTRLDPVDLVDGMTSKKKPTDEELLASLGYKQEFKREFTPLEVFGVAFSIIGLVPSIASVLFYAIAFGGGPAMVWGWAVASVFILTVGISLAELGSAAPTSGGVRSAFSILTRLLIVSQAVFLDI